MSGVNKPIKYQEKCALQYSVYFNWWPYGAFTVDVLYFEGEKFKSDGVFIDYYVDEEDEDGGVTYSAPKRVRFASYNIKTGEFSYPTVITYYRNGKIKEIDY